MDYCGSKTKKCTSCMRNVCNKDLECHDLGECQIFQEEDLRMRIEKDKKAKAEEERRK